MRCQNAKEDIRLVLSWFSEVFSRPSPLLWWASSSWPNKPIPLDGSISQPVISVQISVKLHPISGRKHLWLYGKNKTIKIAKFIAAIKDLGNVAAVVVGEKRKKPRCLISTSIHLSAMDVVKFYAKGWKVEQMIKNLKQRLGFADYRVRNLQGINRHVALTLLSYFALILLKILQWLKDKTACLNLSIRLLAFHVRRHILVERITVTMKSMKIQFKQNILDTYLEQLCV